MIMGLIGIKILFKQNKPFILSSNFISKEQNTEQHRAGHNQPMCTTCTHARDKREGEGIDHRRSGTYVGTYISRDK